MADIRDTATSSLELLQRLGKRKKKRFCSITYPFLCAGKNKSQVVVAVEDTGFQGYSSWTSP
jgi:hypothetical protein